MHDKLNAQILQAHWIDLQFHLQQGNVFGVSKTLKLAVVGQAIATDQTQLVSTWLGDHSLQQITNAQQYENNTLIDILIVQPFVLVQEILNDNNKDKEQ